MISQNHKNNKNKNTRIIYSPREIVGLKIFNNILTKD